MKKVFASVRRFFAEEDGATAVEYAVMVALIVVVALTAIQTLGQQVSDTFQNVSDEISSASGGSSN